MEYDSDDANKGWMDRVKDSPRTVSALIIILIVAAAIYAFSGNQNQQPGTQPEVSPSVTPQQATASPQAQGEQKGQAAQTTPVSQESLKTTVASLPKAEKTNDGYVETAEKGNGLTHLARRATSRYLADNQVSYTITNEHRIYIEDYIRKHLPKKHVAIGQTELVSFDLIKEAVDTAGKLNQKQLHNLTKYTHALK